jgi:hypothetical protein
MGFFNIRIEDDHKKWDAILKEIEKTKYSYVEVGYPNPEIKKKDHEGKTDDTVTVVEVATLMEYGSPKMRIPPRPTLVPTFEEQKEKLFADLKDQYSLVLEGKQTTARALLKIGLFLQKKVIDKINSLFSPPLSKITIELKGSTKPLIDTGQMRQSVKAKVTVTNRPQSQEGVSTNVQ